MIQRERNCPEINGDDCRWFSGIFLFLVAEFAGLDSGVRFEGSAEIKAIFIAYQFSDFLYFHFMVVQKKPFGFVHTQACQVFGWRFAGMFFKYFSSSSQIFFWSKRPESVRKASNSPASD